VIKKFLFTLFIILLSFFGLLKPIQLLAVDLLSPVIIFNRNASKNLQNAFSFYQNIEKIRQENLELRNKEFQLVNFKNIEKLMLSESSEFELIKKLLEEDRFFDDLNGQYGITEIVYYDQAVSKVLLKAINFKFELGDTVTYGRYLVGDIVNIKEDLAEVRLITKQGELVSSILLNQKNQKIKVNVFAENSNQLVVNNILSTEEVQIGDLVYTSSSNPNYPRDLLIGQVDRVEGISSQAFRKAYLGRPFDLEKLRYLVVIRHSR